MRPAAVLALCFTVGPRAAGMPVVEPEIEVLVGLKNEQRDLGVVAEPRIAVAAGVAVVGVEIRAGHPEAGVAGQQRQDANVGGNRLLQREVVALVDRCRLGCGVDHRLAVAELGPEGFHPVESVASLGVCPVGQQRDQRRPAVVEWEPADEVAAEAVLLVAAVVWRARVLGWFIRDNVVERGGDLPAEAGEPGRTAEEVVFGFVVDLDDILVVELADAAVAAVGG